MTEPGRFQGSSGGRRRKRFLSPSEKYEVWIGLLRGEYTTVQAAERAGWKCVPRNGDRPHRFTERLPRQLAHEGYCVSCERVFDRREGPVSARAYSFALKHVVDALLAVAGGVSCCEAAWRARGDAERHPDHGRPSPGQLVADWVELFAPVVFEPHRPRAWPQGTLLLDEQVFRVRRPDRRIGGDPSFTILAAYGYEQGHQGIWRLEAHPAVSGGYATSSVDAEAWAEFLSGLPGCPERIVCDREKTLLGAIEQTWPQADVWICEWHLRKRPAQLLHEYGLDEEHPLAQALARALHSEADWERFKELARALRRRELDTWLRHNQGLVEWQLARKSLARPGQPHSIGALEERLRVIEQRLLWRAGRMTNRERPNRLLLLFQLDLNGNANHSTWTRLIRDWLLVNGGRPAAKQRATTDQHSIPSLRPTPPP
jgi:hypothetical protein